jgi:cystathionine gamma-synthase
MAKQSKPETRSVRESDTDGTDGETAAAFSTLSVHGGERRNKPYRALTTPIVQSSTFTFENTAEILRFVERKDTGQPSDREEYGRYGNPTQRAAERKVAALESGARTERGIRALLFASGMNAITTTLLTLLSSGDHVLITRGCYSRTQHFVRQFLPRWGIDVTFVDGDESSLKAALSDAVRPATRVIVCETPTNPYLRIMDLSQIVQVAREHDLITVIDSTFATPINLRPLEHGLDLVIHSATKYLGGHNDLLAGAVVGPGDLIARIQEARGVLGGVGSPHDAYLLLRGMKTLDLRVRSQNKSAQRVAEHLEGQPAVRRVYYPGLPSHPDHELARRQMTGFGGVVSFDIDGDLERTGRFVDKLRLPYVGPTLGGVESVVRQQAIFASSDPKERQKLGVADNLVRYAVGIENVEDLIADLDQALSGL